MTAFFRRNLVTLFLAASLGLNVTLGIILLTGENPQHRFPRYEQERGWRGDYYRRADLENRREATPDSLRQFRHLEPEQLEALRSLRQDMFTEIEPARTEINSLQRMIREELRSAEPDIARLDSMTARIMRQQNRIQQRTLRLILAEREILSPEQYQAFLRYMVPGQLGQVDRMYDYGRRGRGEADSLGRDRPGNSRWGSDRSGERTPPPPPPYH
jgi:hypothetical protein